jgi:heme/copper-type cytochrome/quinol oxidase subunit 2
LIAAGAVVLALAAIVAPLPNLSLPADAAQPEAHIINVDAKQFSFEPSTLLVQQGDTVTIHLESLDATHGLSIDGYDVNIQAEPGKSADVTFVAGKAGKWKFRCSVSCGMLHPFMIGELDVAPDLPLVRALLATLVVGAGASMLFWKG